MRNDYQMTADSSCTIPYNTSPLRHLLLLSLRRERCTVNVSGEQDKGICHILTQTKWIIPFPNPNPNPNGTTNP